MNKSIILVSLTLSISTFFSNAQDTGRVVVDEIVAVVGDQIVMLSDIERQMAELNFPDSVSKRYGQCEIFKTTLYQKLLVSQATIDSLEISEDEITSEIDRRMNYFISQFPSREEMEKYYDKTIAEIKDEMRQPIKEVKLATAMRNKVVGNFSISPSEVKKFYKELPKDSLPYYNTEVEVGHLVIHPDPTTKEKEKAKAKIEEIRKKVLKGSSFETMAILYSDDPGSQARGGDLGMQPKSAFVPEFGGAAMRLRKDSISGIVETKYGYHIMKLVDRKGEKVQVKHILIRPQITQESIQNAQNELLKIKDRILNDTLTFEQACMLYSDDENTKNSGGTIVDPETATSKIPVDKFGDLDPTLFFVIDTMKVGSISDPVPMTNMDGSTSFRIVFLKNRTLPHVANLKEDYPKIKEMAEAYYQQEILLKWIDKTIGETYITIKEPFLQCEEIKKQISAKSKK